MCVFTYFEIYCALNMLNFLLFLFLQLMLQICHGQKNVLFIVADDLRPQLGAYLQDDYPQIISPEMYTPNLDALASRSLLLKNAHVQQAICSPSRVSTLTSRRPDSTRVYDLNASWREVGGNFTTLPQYFKENGYRTIGLSKVFHTNTRAGDDEELSWSDPYWHPDVGEWGCCDSSWKVAPPHYLEENPFPDQQTALKTMEVLEELSESSDPFFLGVGLMKPHLPFLCPDYMLDYYPVEDISLPLNDFVPQDMPGVAGMFSGELRYYADVRDTGFDPRLNESLPSNKTLELRRAYYCSVTFIDSLVGDIMAKLEEVGLQEDTIVSFWSDNGFKLGEHAMWNKHSNFEVDTHTPMMVHIPDLTDGGIVSDELVEMVDLFPTLAEAAGLPGVPPCPEDAADVAVCTEGMSMMPLIETSEDVVWKDRVFSQYPRWNIRDPSIMGYSMTTDRYRYTEWVGIGDPPEYDIDWEDVSGVELYDHQVDPAENLNLADDPDYEVLIGQLSSMLQSGWRAAIPQ